jgi:hypothetical protein
MILQGKFRRESHFSCGTKDQMPIVFTVCKKQRLISINAAFERFDEGESKTPDRATMLLLGLGLVGVGDYFLFCLLSLGMFKV